MKRCAVLVTAGFAAAMLLSGCALFRASTTDVDPDKPKHMTAKYDYTDLHQLSRLQRRQRHRGRDELRAA